MDSCVGAQKELNKVDELFRWGESIKHDEHQLPSFAFAGGEQGAIRQIKRPKTVLEDSCAGLCTSPGQDCLIAVS